MTFDLAGKKGLVFYQVSPNSVREGTKEKAPNRNEERIADIKGNLLFS